MSSIDSSQLNSAAAGSPRVQGEELLSMTSTATMGHPDNAQMVALLSQGSSGVGPATFGSMVRGRACVERTSLNKDYVMRYQEA